MQLCPELPALLQPRISPPTKQAALVALSALAAAHGKQGPKALLEALPAVLAQVCHRILPVLACGKDVGIHNCRNDGSTMRAFTYWRVCNCAGVGSIVGAEVQCSGNNISDR